MNGNSRNSLRTSLDEAGYCVAEGLLPPALIDRLRKSSEAILSVLDAEHRARNRSQGSLVQLADHPEFSEIIGAAEMRSVFSDLAFEDPRFSSGYLISKPPHSPALFWHQDWWGWDEPLSYTATIPQVFAMVYLTDTTPANGCLRVVPGSHRRRHPLHDAIAAHDEELSRVSDPTHALYQPRDDSVSVEVTAGDVVFGDARLIHGAFPNDSDAERSLLTLWYHPNFGALPAAMRATIRGIHDRTAVDTDPGAEAAITLDGWPDEARQRVADLLVPPVSGVDPHPWNRVPDWDRFGGGDA